MFENELNKKGNNGIRNKKFTINELAGSFGDWGTLIPFIIGYVSIVKMNPAGIFICLGITNIYLGIKFDLPLPVQPQKTISTIALSQHWNSSLVLSTGFGTGIIWFLLGITKKLHFIVMKVPTILVKGIQLGLGLILGWSALQLISDDILLAIIAILIIILSIKYKKLPSAIILVLMGIFVLFFTDNIDLANMTLTLPYFTFHIPNLIDLLFGMIIAGIGQLFLTLTNVMIATIALLKELFPEKSKVIDANALSLNMGYINIFSPLFGGIPLCHGSGGVAAQFAFGARTGGSMILEGIFEIVLGVFFSNFLLLFFMKFPLAILGSMLLYTALLLARVSFKDFDRNTFVIISLPTAIVCFFFNVAIGFAIGLVIYLILSKWLKKDAFK